MPNTRKAKYVQDIEEAIDAIRRRVEECQSYFDHEAQTRYWLIDPMLRALGWDLSDAEQVVPEFYRYTQKSHRRVDYAFFSQEIEKPLIIVEAKSIQKNDICAYLSEDYRFLTPAEMKDRNWHWNDKQIKQIRRSTSGLRTGYGVLTDGVFWSIFDLSKKGSFDKMHRERVDVSILNCPLKDSVGALKLLRRRNVLELR